MSRHRLHGFTLIEVLVALALMAMIATILIASLEIGGHTWQRVIRATTRSEEIAQTQYLLRHQLGALYPYQRSTETEAPRFLVSDGHQVEFSSSAPLARSDGIWRYQLLVTKIGTLTLRSRRDRNGRADPRAAEWADEILLVAVDQLSLQFWQKSPDEAGHWVDQWTDSNTVPALIRVEVIFAARDPRRWPPLYIGPRVDTDAQCVFDVVSRRCRSSA